MSVAPSGFLAVIADDLERGLSRLDAALSVTELTTIYTNAAHAFTFLDGNHRQVNYEALLPLRDAYFENLDLDAALSAARCPDPAGEVVRSSWVDWLRGRAPAADRRADRRVADLQTAARGVLDTIRADQAALLRRLGVRTGAASADAMFSRAVAAEPDRVRREKLTRAWYLPRDRREEELLGLLDQMVEVRREQARRRGCRTVLEHTLRGCGIREADAERFLRAFLEGAVRGHVRLAAEIRDTVGGGVRPFDHFGYHVRALLGDRHLPLLPLDACLEYLRRIADRVFGLTTSSATVSQITTLSVRSGEHPVGTIRFHVPAAGSPPAAAAVPVSLPIGHVLCRTRPDSRGVQLITFDAAQSLVHEFGHAVNHLLIRERRPGDSGLDYLPAERIEELSSWFEEWVYHPDFAAHLPSPRPEAEAGLALSRRVKALEFTRTSVERAAVAMLDLEVHRSTGGTLRDCFRRLDDEYALSEHCDFGRLVEHFTWPMFRAHPGANLAYLWGAADGAQRFQPFLGRTLSELSPGDLGGAFTSCLDPDAPSAVPDVTALFQFHNELSEAGAAA